LEFKIEGGESRQAEALTRGDSLVDELIMTLQEVPLLNPKPKTDNGPAGGTTPEP